MNIIVKEHTGIGSHNEYILGDFKIDAFSWETDEGISCYGSAKIIPR